MVVCTKDTIGSRTFTITAEDVRQEVEGARKKSFDDTVADIERQIISAAREQEWGITVDMFHYNIELEDIDTIFALLEKQGFILDYSDSGGEVYITWDDEYDNNKLYS